jgi:hypothetical protein
MMFAIDLLKGKALPAKIDLKKSLFKAVPLLIPVLAVTVFAAACHHDKKQRHTYQQTLNAHQQQIEAYAADIAEYNAINRQVTATGKYLKDIARALSCRVQVSDVLNELVGALPEDIFVYEMNMDRKSILEKITQEGSGENKQKLVVQRNLKLVLCGFDADKTDPAVQRYLHQLEKSPLLSEVFTQVKHSARQQGQVDKKDAVYYEIECTLREQES